MKISILYDNTSRRQDMEASWGFSALVESENETVLFDAGGEWDILKENMKAMEVDPGIIDRIVISHDHWDHQGGLNGLLKSIDVPVHIPKSFETDVYSKRVWVEGGPRKICQGIHTTGELGNFEQSIMIDVKGGVFMVVGCSHPGLSRILDEGSRMGKVIGVVGGFHDFSELSRLRDLELIIPTHCTQRIDDIRRMYPEKYMRGGAGTVIEMDS